MKAITLLTDFGTKDSYVAQMKGILAQRTNAQIFDITHDITPHNVREGAFILRSVVPYYPSGTVHIAIVDPGVGTKRRPLLIATPTCVLIGPDNGVLLPAAHLFDNFVVYELLNKTYMGKSISHPFHGRDIFAPVAAHVVEGVAFDELGKTIMNFVDLKFETGSKVGTSIEGQIVYIDRFGNAVTNISAELMPQISDTPKTLSVKIGKKRRTLPFVHSYGSVKKGALLATIGSGNFLEISANQASAASKLSLKESAPITIMLD